MKTYEWSYTCLQDYSDLPKSSLHQLPRTRAILGAVWPEDLIVGQGTPNKRQDGVMGAGLALDIRAMGSNMEWTSRLLCEVAKNSPLGLLPHLENEIN